MKKVTNFNLKPGTYELVLQKHFSVESIRHSQVIFMCIDLVKILKGSLRILKDLHEDLHEDLNKDLQGS